MELEKLLENIEKNPLFKQVPALEGLAKHFESLALLHYAEKDGTMNGEHLAKFAQALENFWSSFHDAAEVMGLDPNLLRANLNNPVFFAPEQWTAMQAIRQEITGEKPVDPKAKKRRRNKKKSVRI